MGLAARRVPPSTAWWPQPVALLLPVLAAATGLAGLGWAVAAVRTGRSGAAVAAGIHLLVAGAAGARAVGGGEGEAGSPVPSFRVLTLNAAYSRRGDADLISRRFQTEQPHVVALQEVSIRPHASSGGWVAQGAGLALLTDSTYALTRLSRPEAGDGWLTNGTALFTRLPASRSDAVLLDTVSVTNSGRYTRTEVEWEGTRVAVYNVHFRSFTTPRPWRAGGGAKAWVAAVRSSGRDFVAREAEARTLRRALDAEALPFVVLGDFNATPDHWSYAHVSRGLVDALGATLGRAATYPDRRPLVRIDAILASPEWAVRRASVQPAGVSDHRPVLAELVLRRP